MVAPTGRSRHSGQGAVALSRSFHLSVAVLGLLLPLLICCQAEPFPTLAAAAHPIEVRSQVTAPGTGYAGVPTWTPTPRPTAVLSATAPPGQTPTPPVTPTPPESLAARHLSILDQLCQIVQTNYLYPDYNGLNWEGWGAVYREQVAAGMTDAEFHWAMADLVAKLDDGHSVFQPPAAAQDTAAIIRGQYRIAGIGVDAAPRPETGRAVLLDVFPQSPAWQAGLRPHDSILALDGYPVLDRLPELVGPAGSTVSLLVQTPGQSERQVNVVRTLVNGPPPVSARRLTDADIVVLTIRTFWDQRTAPAVRRSLQQSGPLSGLVIDVRTNRGGSEVSLKGTLGFFADGILGYFTRQTGERPLQVTLENIHNSQTVPLVILVGRETSSYAEIFAGVLQSAGRAVLVGTVTQGNVETIWPYDFEDGSRLWIAQEGFRPLDARDWEQDGLLPDFYVPGDWADFTAATDTQLAMALQLLRQEPPLP